MLLLTGGEATLHPDFFDILKNIEVKDLILFTNLNMNINKLENILSIRPNIQIQTSYHYRYTNIEEYFSKIKYLEENKVTVYSIIMWETEYKNEIISIFNRMKELNINVKVSLTYVENIDYSLEERYESLSYDSQKAFNNPDKTNSPRGRYFYIKYYDDCEEKIIEDLDYNDLNHLNIFNFQNFECDCGARNIFIECNGDVYYCQTYRIRNRNIIFNVNKNDYHEYDHILTKSIICQEEQCCCELHVPKRNLAKIKKHEMDLGCKK